jgi:EAL domain-containing protein (putative c-di-GMP-specific phosphodiesterase class I)
LSYLHLQKIPLDTLKVDRSFVSNMLQEERRMRSLIVDWLQRLADEHAEGETTAERDAVIQLV